MNYGKSATLRRIQKYDSKGKKIQNKVKIIFLKVFLAVVIVAGAAGVSSGIGIMSGIIDSAPDISSIDVTPTGYSTTVLASNGEQTATLVGSGANRQYVTIDEIPVDLQYAFVAVEDERFYDLNGIDLHAADFTLDIQPCRIHPGCAGEEFTVGRIGQKEFLQLLRAVSGHPGGDEENLISGSSFPLRLGNQVGVNLCECHIKYGSCHISILSRQGCRRPLWRFPPSGSLRHRN